MTTPGTSAHAFGLPVVMQAHARPRSPQRRLLPRGSVSFTFRSPPLWAGQAARSSLPHGQQPLTSLVAVRWLAGRDSERTSRQLGFRCRDSSSSRSRRSSQFAVGQACKPHVSSVFAPARAAAAHAARRSSLWARLATYSHQLDSKIRGGPRQQHIQSYGPASRQHTDNL